MLGRLRDIKFKVQHQQSEGIAFLRCAVSESLSRSSVQVVGDRVALMLGE